MTLDAAEKAGVPVVRGLVWESINSSSMWAAQKWATATEFWWCYRVALTAERAHSLVLEMGGNHNIYLGLHSTWDEAAIAAQADYEQRILSALNPDFLSELDTARAEIERLRTQGNWAVLHDVLNYLNTLEDRVVAKKDIYAAVMEMRPHPPVSQDENFQDYHEGVVAALVERMNAAESALTAAQERIAEQRDAIAKAIVPLQAQAFRAEQTLGFVPADLAETLRVLHRATLSPAVKEPK